MTTGDFSPEIVSSLRSAVLENEPTSEMPMVRYGLLRPSESGIRQFLYGRKDDPAMLTVRETVRAMIRPLDRLMALGGQAVKAARTSLLDIRLYIPKSLAEAMQLSFVAASVIMEQSGESDRLNSMDLMDWRHGRWVSVTDERPFAAQLMDVSRAVSEMVTRPLIGDDALHLVVNLNELRSDMAPEELLHAA